MAQHGRRRAETPKRTARTLPTPHTPRDTKRTSARRAAQPVAAHPSRRSLRAQRRPKGVNPAAPAATIALTAGLVFTFGIPAYALDPITLSTTDPTADDAVVVPDVEPVSFEIDDQVYTIDDEGDLNLDRTTAKAESALEEDDEDDAGEMSFSGNAVLKYGSTFFGTPYKWGGTTPSGFDCSGFTAYVYRKFGINLPHSSRAQYTGGKKISKSQAKPGDLVYTPGHIGIYVGNGKIMHAPRPGKSVQVSKMWSDSWSYVRY